MAAYVDSGLKQSNTAEQNAAAWASAVAVVFSVREQEGR